MRKWENLSDSMWLAQAAHTRSLILILLFPGFRVNRHVAVLKSSLSRVLHGSAQHTTQSFPGHCVSFWATAQCLRLTMNKPITLGFAFSALQCFKCYRSPISMNCATLEHYCEAKSDQKCLLKTIYRGMWFLRVARVIVLVFEWYSLPRIHGQRWRMGKSVFLYKNRKGLPCFGY